MQVQAAIELVFIVLTKSFEWAAVPQ